MRNCATSFYIFSSKGLPSPSRSSAPTYWPGRENVVLVYDLLERCALRRLSLELLSKPKPRVYELDGGAYVSSRVAPLDAGVLTDMVDAAESILHDYRHWVREGG